MKKIYILLLLVVGFYSANAQKILFDNTRGETASNADWVIDADVRNLSSTWPATTSGTEGNAQITPTPAQSGISSSTSETYWNSAISAWGVDIAKYCSSTYSDADYWHIEQLPYDGRVTYGDATNTQDLSNYKTYIMVEPNSLFTATEKTAIKNFVNNGGGLFIVSDHTVADRNNDNEDAVSVLNDLLSSSSGFNGATGIIYEVNNISESPSTNINTNLPGTDPLLYGPWGNVISLKYNNGSSMAINTSNNSTVKGVVFRNTYSITGTTGVLCAYAEYGSGRIVALGDSSPVDDGTGDPFDHLYVGWGYVYSSITSNANLAMNGTIWLMSPSVSGPALSLSPVSLTGFSYVEGAGPSAEQTVSLSGTELDGTSVTVTAPTNYEISLTSGSGFASSLNINYTAPTLASTTIYIRLKSGLTTSTYNESITFNDNGTATDQNLSVDGAVTSAAGVCVSETFENIPASSSSYATRTWTGDNGSTWTAYVARTDKTINTRAICFRSSVLSPTSSGGIGDLTVTTKYPYSDGSSTLDVRVNGSSIGSVPISTTEQTTTISGIDISGDVYIEIFSDGTKRAAIDDLSWTCFSGAATPTLSVTPSTLIGFTYVFGGGPSAEQSFALSGANLDGTDVVLTAPANYEISLTSGSGFTSPITLASYDGSSTTVFVRLAAGLAVNTYNSQSITITGGGDTDGASVSPLNGEVTPVSVVTLSDNATQIAVGNVSQGDVSHILSTFKLTVGDAQNELSQVDFTTSGTYSATDITKFQLWYNTADNFAAASKIGSDISASLGQGTHSFSGLSQTLSVANHYFWITTDVSATATVGNTINVSAIDNADLTFVSGTKSGSATAGGLQTIIEYIAPQVFISEIASAGIGGDFNDEYIEISNIGTSGVNMDGWYLEYYNEDDVREANVALSGTLASGDAWVIAARSSYNSITPDFVSSFSMNSYCYVKLKNNSGVVFDEAGTAVSDEFSQNNFEFINCTGDNLTVANWENLGSNNGTPGVVNCLGDPADVVIADNGTQVGASTELVSTTNVILHQSQITVSTENATLTGISCVSSGTYLASDISNFKVYYSVDNVFDGADALLSTYNNPGVAGTKTFPSFTSQSIIAGNTGYIFITADLSATAAGGRNIMLNALTTDNYSFSNAIKTGTTTDGGLKTFYDAEVNLAQNGSVAAANVSQGQTNVLLSSWSLTSSAGNATLNTASMLVTGSFVTADIATAGFKLWTSTTNDFSTAVQAGSSVSATADGFENIDFTGLTVSVNQASAVYFWFTVDISVSATSANDIRNQTTTGANFFYDENVHETGSYAAEGIQTITSPSITLADNGTQISAGDVLQGTTNHVISSFIVSSANSSSSLTGIDINLAGSYIISDIEPAGIKLWYNTSNDFATATTLASASVSGSGGAGELISFSGLSQTLSVANHYFWITTDVSATATVGNTINVSAIDNADLTFVSGTKSGSATAGGLQTIILRTNCASDLIISEYVEGTDNYIEIYNNTGAVVDLSDYQLRRYANGGTSPNESVVLSGNLADGDVIVYGNSGATEYSGTFTVNAACIFNGDDAMALYKISAGANIDVVGIIGNTSEPGAGVTLVRKLTVYAGTTTYNTAEWDSYSVDNVSHLGSHLMVCTCEEPTLNASDIIVSNIAATSLTLSWTNGDGLSRIVVARMGDPVNWAPVDLNTYTANPSFGSGTELGTGNYIVYNGSSNSVNITNLAAGTSYYFKIYEYGCQPGSEDYLLTGTIAEEYATTMPNNVTNFKILCTTNTSAELSWNLPSGEFDGILVTVTENGAAVMPDCAGNTLINPVSDFATADLYCSSLTSVYVYNNVGTSASITGLTAGQTYTFKIFVYKNEAWSTGNTQIQIAEVSDVIGESANCGNAESQVVWTNPLSSCYDEILVVAREASSVTATPSGDGSLYTANPVFGSGTPIVAGQFVVFKGAGSMVNVTSLTNDLTYYFKIFVRNGTHWSAGVEVSCSPTTATFFEYGDLAIVGINTDTDDALSGSSDEIQFVCFVPITTNTAIDFTDNGYERLYEGLWADSEGTIRLTRTGADLPAGTVVTVRGRAAAANWTVWIGDGTDTKTLISDGANWSISDGGSGNNTFDLNSNDQIWIMQGGGWINPAGVHNATYTGKVLYGWTAIGWEPAPGYDDTKGSTIVGGAQCSNTNVVGVLNEDKVKYNDIITDASVRDWISRFNDDVNWEGYTTSVDYNAGGTLPDVIGITGTGFSTTAQWTGETSSDWDDCTNWLNLKVPDATSGVIFITDNCSNDIIILPGQTVYCDNLTIQGILPTHKIRLEGDNTKVLEIRGDINIGGPEALSFDDADANTLDGRIILYGNWINTAGQSSFIEGNSSIEFVGTTAQTISNTVDVDTFYNISVNNSSAEGVILSDNNLVVTGTFSHSQGIFDLNALDITLSGPYVRTAGAFKGNSASSFTVNGAGVFGNVMFSFPEELYDLNFNRAAETMNLVSDLHIYNNLNIDNGTVSMSPSKYYDVDATLTNNAGAAGLILKSDNLGTASLIHNTTNVIATSQRFLSANQWHFVFAPLSAIPTSTISSSGNFWKYDETQPDYWDINTIYGTSGWVAEANTNLLVSQGYIKYLYDNNTYNFTGGNLFAGQKDFAVSYTVSGLGVPGPEVTKNWTEFDGWNLIGNPYASAFNWDNASIDKTDIENVVYYYDGNAANYKYYGGGTTYDQGITVNGGSQYVPANQAFYVKATANGTFSIPNSARVHNAQSFWKTKNENEILRIQIEKGDFYDETVIRNLPFATDEHDKNIDAYKMFSMDITKPQIFTRNQSGNFYFAINSLFVNEESKIVPLSAYIPVEGTYTLRFTENTFADINIWFEDRFEGVFLNLNNAQEYVFNSAVADNNERFFIHFEQNTAPVLNFEIPDQETITGEDYQYYIPENLFTETNFGDYFTISVTSAGGEALPEWLNFNPVSGRIFGNPDQEQTVNILVTATDRNGAQTSDEYMLTVKSNLSEIGTINSASVLVYPNPASDIVNVQFVGEISSTQVSITDISGKILHISNQNSGIFNVDISNFAQGLYFIDIRTEKGIFRTKFVKK